MTIARKILFLIFFGGMPPCPPLLPVSYAYVSDNVSVFTVMTPLYIMLVANECIYRIL